MKITIPTYLKTIMHILEKANEEVYLVGGFVRDMLMHKPCHDYDLTTSAHPDTMIQLFQNHDYSLILTGKQHGTIMIQTHHTTIEITTYRTESNYKNHRSPDTIIYANTIYEDLKRRDFTINAIAYHPLHGIIDPFHGQQDIKKQILKAVGDPFIRLQEDALRILRAIRFQCCLSFTIEANTTQAILQHAHLLSYISKERIQQEFYKILTSPQKNLIQLLDSYHILPYIFPLFTNILNKQELQQLDTILNRSLHQSFTIRFATLLYGFLTYYPIEVIIQYLKEMKYAKKVIQPIQTLLSYQSYTLQCTASLRKLLFLNDNNFLIVEEIILFQYITQNIHKKTYDHLLTLLINMRQDNDTFHKSDLAINGHDLRSLGYQGKQIHDTLVVLYDLVIQNPSFNTKESLMSYIKHKRK